MSTIFRDVPLRKHMCKTIKDLPNNLPRYNESRLLDDLCFLLLSPLFLCAISPRLTCDSDNTIAPSTLMSTTSETSAYNFDLASLDIRIKWDKNGWATQLMQGDSMLLEGRDWNAPQEVGFEQSFLWFCEEAYFLYHEYKAREDAWAAKKDEAANEGRLKQGGNTGGGSKAPAKSKAGQKRRVILTLQDSATAKRPAWMSRM